MTDNFKNKYRISSARAQWWDYGWDASYFITICTKNSQCVFGHVADGKMHLSHLGVIADICWFEITNHAKNIKLGEYIIMPNHMHGILVIDGNNQLRKNADGFDKTDKQSGINEQKQSDEKKLPVGENSVLADMDFVVETRHALSLPQNLPYNVPPLPKNLSLIQPPPKKTIGQQRFQNQGKNTISSIVGGYKSAVTKHANRLGFEFKWQARFHDHIIRDEAEFHRISKYIINNPSKWEEDKFFNK